MEARQLALDDLLADAVPDDGATPPAPRPAPADRAAFADFLATVADRVRAESRAALAAPGGGGPARAARLRATLVNAQAIAGRARRAIDALPGHDLELLRAWGRLAGEIVAATETRRRRGL